MASRAGPPWRPWKLDILQSVMLLLVVVFAVATVLVPAIVARGQAAIEHTRRQNIGWIGVRAIQELQYAEIAVLSCERKLDVASSCGDAQVASDIIAARIETWGHGSFGEYVLEDPERSRLLQRLRDDVPRLEAAIGALETSDGVARALKILEDMRLPVEEIAAQSFAFAYRAFEESNSILSDVQNTQHVMLFGLLGCGFVLIALFVFQNRLLQRAYAHERKVAEEQAHLANHDALTGLAKREAFRSHLKMLAGRPIAILAIDLDGFKPVNDVFGHLAGDAVLVSVAQRLMDAIGSNPGDLASRFGGDEFFVVLADADLATARSVADAILKDLRRPHVYDGHLLTVNASIGIAVHGAADESIVRNADLALNRAKTSGKNCILAYEAEMGEEIEQLRRLESDLEGAAARGEFVPYYQPQIDMATGRIEGVEAQVRWLHPARGMLELAEFLMVAESSGQIVGIGRAMLDRVCRDAVAFAQPIRVSVNVSAIQWLRSDIPAIVAKCLAETGLAASRLTLEISEGAVRRDEARFREAVDRLHALGVSVSLDSFGAGHSSISYLYINGFSFDEVKTDCTLLSRVGLDHGLPIVRGLANFCRQSEIRLVMQSVETADEASVLIDAGCEIGQGGLYHRPMPVADFAGLLQAGTRRSAHTPQRIGKAIAAE